MPVGPGTMPIPNVTVLAWDNGGQLWPVYLDPEDGDLYGQADGVGFREGCITHWRYCNGPDGIGNKGVASFLDASKPAAKTAAPEITRDSMRILGEQAGEHALKDLEGCVDPAVAFEGWRDHCYAELAEEYAGHVDLPDLLTVWSRARDSVQPLGLTQKESDLLKTYRLSDDRGRETLSEAAERMAEDWPRYTFVVPRENCGEGA
jgi:hypothetical protein